LAPDTGEALPWNPGVFGRANVNAGVFAIEPEATRIYVGGIFTNIGGLFRTNIAALSLETGEATPWNPNSSGGQAQSQGVYTLLLAGEVLYAGGEFGTIGRQTRNRLAAISVQTGQALAWDPNANGLVTSFALKDNSLIVGGAFTQIGGQVRNRIAAIDTTSGQATSWNPDAGSTANLRVYSIATFGNLLYAGGQFNTMGGEFRNRLGSVTSATGQARPWKPDLDNIVRTLVVAPDAIYAGGDFTTVGGTSHRYFAVFSNQPEFDASALHIANDEIQAPLRTGEGQRVVIQFSSDLKAWQDLTTANPGAPTELKDSGVSQQPSRFYRAVLETPP
jgi:hypothetical protein